MPAKSSGRASAQPDVTEGEHSRRAAIAELEQGLTQLSAGGSGSENNSSTSVNRRRSLQDTQGTGQGKRRKKGSKRGGSGEAASPPAPPPAQHVQRLAAPTVERDSTSGSRVVNPSQLPKGREDAIVAALAGGRLPSSHDSQPEPFVAVPKGTAKPPGRPKHHKGGSGGGGGGGGSWLQWLKSMIFSKEEFTEFAPGQVVSPVTRDPRSELPSSSSSSSPTCADADSAAARRWLRRVAAKLDEVRWLPGWGKRFVFDTVDFFTRARVYLVLAILVIVIGVAAAPKTADALSAMSGTFIVEEQFRPGKTFLEKFNDGRRELPHKHPVAILPGFITGALELWEARGTCLDKQITTFSTFRQYMFGAQMIFLLLTDPTCWFELFGMDKTTGKDKDGIKVRAGSGFESVEYFVPGYWVWAKILVNLADIGYDPQSMAIMTYDWRLSPGLTHERDGFFYSVRNTIKFLCQKNRARSVVISHSYGTTVALAFFKWEEQREPGFMNKYVAYYVNVGGTTMGIPKAASALLMGDVKDTVMIPSTARKIFDSFMAQNSRYNLTRSWSCLYAMVPHGCDAAFPDVFTFADGSSAGMETVMDMIIDECERSNHTRCVDEMLRLREEVNELPVLPQAPNTTVVCLYGVNKSSEVGYALEDVGRRSRLAQNSITGESVGTTTTSQAPVGVEFERENCEVACDNAAEEEEGESSEGYNEEEEGEGEEDMDAPFRDGNVAKWMTNTSHNDAETLQGVRLGNGDGTVPLASLAYMCRAPNGWVRNVGRVETVEFLNDAARANPLNLRGGAISGDHVDILGNYGLLETILKIASGVDELGGEEGMDEVQWVGDDEELLAIVTGNANSNAGRKKRAAAVKKASGAKTFTLHRRVRTNILSDVDERIRTDWAQCLDQPNNPITPKRSREDDNEFL